MIKFYPTRSIRDSGEKKFVVSFEGKVAEPVKIKEPCFISFKGHKLGARFSRCAQQGNGWIATLETVIPISEFWQDDQPPLPPQ